MKQLPAVSRPDGDSPMAAVDMILDSLNRFSNGNEKILRRWQRLAGHPETHATIERLIERGNSDERANPELFLSDLVFFLYDALAVPDYWDYLRAKPKNHQREEARNLHHAAQVFHSSLARHKTLASMYLSRLPEPGNHFARVGAPKKLDNLLKTVLQIRDNAATGRHLPFDEEVPKLPRKVVQASAKEAYCIRALGSKAKETLGPFGVQANQGLAKQPKVSGAEARNRASA